MVNKKEQPKRLYSTKIASEIPGAIHFTLHTLHADRPP